MSRAFLLFIAISCRRCSGLFLLLDHYLHGGGAMLAAFALLRAPVFGTSLLFLLLTADEPIAGRVAIGFTNGFVLFLFAALLCSLVFHSTHFCY